VASTSVLVDAGALIAYFNKSDSEHAALLGFFNEFFGQAITTWPALTEAVHLVERRHEIAVMRLIERGRLEVLDITPGITRIIALMEQYADRPIDLADASLVWAAELTGILRIVTIDRQDFTVYRARGRPFDIVP